MYINFGTTKLISADERGLIDDVRALSLHAS